MTDDKRYISAFQAYKEREDLLNKNGLSKFKKRRKNVDSNADQSVKRPKVPRSIAVPIYDVPIVSKDVGKSSKSGKAKQSLKKTSEDKKIIRISKKHPKSILKSNDIANDAGHVAITEKTVAPKPKNCIPKLEKIDKKDRKPTNINKLQEIVMDSYNTDSSSTSDTTETPCPMSPFSSVFFNSVPFTMVEKLDEFDIENVLDDESIADSRDKAKRLFSWMIAPMSLEEFDCVFEKRACHVMRVCPDYNKKWMSSKVIDDILRKFDLQYGVNLDITTYENGMRETHNLSGRVHPSVVWDYYNHGCSLRLLNPQTYHEPVYRFLVTLQDYFNCFVGANVYLTPAGSQGFAPHFDDIEAFVLQLEGKKHWRLYAPRNKEETLSRSSSTNFSDNDDLGPVMLDVILEPGDLLYFPRGTIHQAIALPDSHSLHITVSAYQQNSYYDFLRELLPRALNQMMQSDVSLKTGLPRQYLSCFGEVRDASHPCRERFTDTVKKMVVDLADHLPLDEVADLRGQQLSHNALPPYLNNGDQRRSVVGPRGLVWMNDGPRCPTPHITLKSRVRLTSASCCRLVIDGAAVLVYYSSHNPRVYQGAEQNYFEVTAECVPAIRHLFSAYPSFTLVSKLPSPDDVDDKFHLALLLYERCLLVTKK